MALQQLRTQRGDGSTLTAQDKLEAVALATQDKAGGDETPTTPRTSWAVALLTASGQAGR